MNTAVATSASGTRHRVALPRSRHAPAVARRVTARWLSADAYGPGAASDALLIVSELVTNSLRHTSGPCTLTLTGRAPTVDIAVTDTSETLPRVAHTTRDERGGFGMAMLVALGARLSVERSPHGKTVHAVLGLPTGRRPTPE